MKRNVKIVTLVLACLLLIGSAIGISAFAEETKSVSIVHKNIAYEGAVKILYAIDAEGLDADEEVMLYFYDSEDSAEPTVKKALFDETVTIDGEEYALAFSEGIAPKNLRKTVYAKPVIVNADGDVVKAGDMVEYSVWQYAINRFSKSYTPDQAALYTALLDYAAGVQKVLIADGGYTEAEVIADGGYANEYYVLNLDTVVDGTKTATSQATFAADEVFTGEFELQAAKIVSGAYFDGFTDGNGDLLTEYGTDKTAASWNKLPLDSLKLGVNSFNLNYKTPEIGKVYGYNESANSESYVTFAENVINVKPGTSAENPGTTTLTTDKNGVESTTVIPNKGYAIVTDLNGESVLEFTRRIRVLEATVYPEGTEDTSGAYAVGEKYNAPDMPDTSIYFSSSETVADAASVRMHVFETDFYVQSSVTGTTLLQIDLVGAGGTLWGVNLYYNYNTLQFTVHGGDNNSSTVASNIDSDEWHNLRIEYAPTLGNTMSVRVYIDGKFTGTDWLKPASTAAVAGELDTALTKVQAYLLYSAEDTAIFFDNTLISTVENSDYKDKGLYYDDEKTNKDGVILPTYSFGGDVGSTYAEDGGNKAIKITRPHATSGSSLYFNVSDFGVETYIFEADIKWLETSHNDGASNYCWGGRIGFQSTASSSLTNDPALLHSQLWQTAPDYGLVINGASDNAFKTATDANHLKPGYWYNLRFEYTPTGYTVAEDGTVTYTGVNNIYVNNVLLRSDSKSSTTSNLDFYRFFIWMRGYYGAEFLLDNIFVGGVGEYSAETFESGAAQPNWKFNTQKNSSSGITYDLAASSVVDDPLHTDTAAAANKVLKFEMKEYDNATSSRITYDLNTINIQNKSQAEGNGVYEFSFDMYYEDYVLPSSGSKLIQTIIPQTSLGYFQILYIYINADGTLKFSTTTGTVKVDGVAVGGGKGGDIVNNVQLKEGEFNHIKITFTKNGTSSYTGVAVNGVELANKNYYHNSPVATDGLPMTSAYWRLQENPITTTADDGSTITENKYNLYIDNFVFKYVGPVEAE